MEKGKFLQMGGRKFFFGREDKQRRERRKILGEGKDIFFESEKKRKKTCRP